MFTAKNAGNQGNPGEFKKNTSVQQNQMYTHHYICSNDNNLMTILSTLLTFNAYHI